MSWTTRLAAELDQFRQDGVYKRLNHLASPQGPRVQMEGRGEVVILSSNNYLGLCAHPDVVAAGEAALERFGAGTGSVRFICGTFVVHRDLEAALARLVGCESSLTYVSCWNANEGLCPTLLGEQDIVISDQLNHASIIDAIRLAKTITKCQTAVYKHSDMTDLEEKLRAARSARTRLIFTDGVFSMEGDLARLPDIVALARRYDAIVAMDDSHATGVMGHAGRGTAEHYGMLGDVDIITSTLGKALGGAAGGFTAGPAVLTDYLTQRSRPQLFSNALPPTVASSALAAVRTLEAHPDNAWRFTLRMGMRYVKSLRESDAERVMAARAIAPFESLEDFARRTSLDAGALMALAKAGAFEGLGVNRREALWQVRALAKRHDMTLPVEVVETVPRFDGLGRLEVIAWDYDASSHSVRGHPLEPLREEFTAAGLPDAQTVTRMSDGDHVRYAGLVICRQTPGTASGVTFMTLEDETGLVNLVVWPKIFEQHLRLAKSASLLGVTGRLQKQQGVVHIVVQTMWRPELKTRLPAVASRDFH